MVALAVLGVVVIVVIVPLLAGFVIFSDTVDGKPRGYRVRQVVGFAIVAAGASIMFLPVSTETDGFHVTCGSALGAMFSEWDNGEQCGSAAFPYLWIAGGVAAVGIGVSFWGAGRGRLLAAVCIPLLVVGSIGLVAFIFSGGGVAGTGN